MNDSSAVASKSDSAAGPARGSSRLVSGHRSVGNYVVTLRRHWSVALAVLITTTAVVLEAFSVTERYQATARLSIETSAAAITGDPAVDLARGGDAESLWQNLNQTLIGRDLARRVLAQLVVDGVPEYDSSQTRAAAPLQVVTRWVRRWKNGEKNAENVERFVEAVHVERVGGSQFVNVTFTAPDSQFAKRAVNMLADEYVQRAARVMNVRIVEHAEMSTPAPLPIGLGLWSAALSLGFIVALGVTLALDSISDTLRSPEDITRRLDVSVLGSVPAIQSTERSPLYASSHVPRDFGAAFRAVRIALLSKYPQSGTKLLAVTSARPFEGKTTVAANIAMALADGGARVLVVDADMRQPGLQRPLRLNNERGLSQVLAGQARVRDVIQRTVDPNLLAITAGKAARNPSELLSSERMKALLGNLTQGAFDWVVIDTPAVLDEVDAAILATSVTGVVYVIRAEMTKRRVVERGLQTISSAGAGSVAVLLNKVDSRTRPGRPTESDARASASHG